MKNHISSIKDERGVIVTDDDQIKHVIVDFLKEFTFTSIGANVDHACMFEGVQFSSIPDEQRDMLARPFMVEEVHTALKNMHETKALGRMVFM